MRLRPQLHTAPLLAQLFLSLLVAMTGCTSSATVGASRTSTVAPAPRSTDGTNDSGPVSRARVTERPAQACPYVDTDTATADVGYRLDRIAELVQGGGVVGCRFYALQHPTAQCDQACLDHERLPPAGVPGIEILATRYRTPTDAHNAFIVTAEAGSDVQQAEIEPGNTGLCYRTTVWQRDNGRDWACAFAKGHTTVVIRTVVTAPALNVVELARAVAPRF